MEYKLDNGLKIYHHKINTPHVDISMLVDFGGNMLDFQDKGKNVNLKSGSAHYFEHILFSRRDGGDGLKQLGSLGANDCNGCTSPSQTYFYFQTRINPFECLDVLNEIVFDLYLQEERFYREQGIILSERQNLDDNPYATQQLSWIDQLFFNRGLRAHALGTPEDIKSISIDDVKKIYSVFYRPSNMKLIVVGDIDINRLIEKYEGKYESPPTTNIDEPNESRIKMGSVESKMPETAVMLGWKNVRRNNLEMDVATMFAMRALFAPGSMYRQELRDEGISDSGFFEFNTHEKGYILTGINALKDAEKSVESVMKLVDKVRLEGLKESEIEYARKIIMVLEDGVEGIGIADRFRWFNGFSQSPLDYLKALSMVETMSVADVNSRLGVIFNPEAFSACYAKPKTL